MSFEEWKEYKLEDFCEQKRQGYVPNGVDDIKYIGLEHIDQQTLSLNSIGTSKQVTSNKFKFDEGDILFGKLRPYFRKVYRPKFSGVCSTDIMVLNAKKMFDQGFLFYFLANQDFIDISSAGSSGTRMPRADWNHLKYSKWKIPPLEIQHKIAAILSSLDDKIELNRQTNKTLEAIAQALFKEWFVDFNFPGATGEMQESELGEIPKGWKVGSILDIAKLIGGGTPKTVISEYWNGDVKWLSAKDVSQNNGSIIIDTEKKVTQAGIDNSSAKIIEALATIVSARGTVGNLCLLSEPMAMSQSNYALKAKGRYGDYFIFLSVSNIISRLQQMSYGTIFDTITTETLRNLKIVLPNSDLAFAFNEKISYFFEKMQNNIFEIETLTQLRDNLLPKLMNGEINLKILKPLTDEQQQKGITLE